MNRQSNIIRNIAYVYLFDPDGSPVSMSLYMLYGTVTVLLYCTYYCTINDRVVGGPIVPDDLYLAREDITHLHLHPLWLIYCMHASAARPCPSDRTIALQ